MFGEDLAADFRDVGAIAKRYCRGCADYHITYIGKRLADPEARIDADRSALVAMLARLLSRQEEQGGALDVAIAGSADTGVLATCVGAASRAGIADRVRYTVLDRCGTPLELCRRYAQRNGLNVATRTDDLFDADLSNTADIVIVHSLLRFIPRERHRELLVALSRWLKPEGRLLLRHSLRAPGEAGQQPRSIAKLLALIEAGAIELPEPRDEFVARLVRSTTAGIAEYGDMQDLIDLFADTPLEILDNEESGEDVVVPGKTARRRVMLVAGRRRD